MLGRLCPPPAPPPPRRARALQAWGQSFVVSICVMHWSDH